MTAEEAPEFSAHIARLEARIAARLFLPIGFAGDATVRRRSRVSSAEVVERRFPQTHR